MLRHHNIDRVCCGILALVLLLTALLTGVAVAIPQAAAQVTMGYENLLFDQRRVHTIDIIIDDWDAFLDSATSEEYSVCHLVIDGEVYRNVAIRGKGNTSLSSVASYGNDRYSFKVEFDHYQTGNTYHGLDKLSLNNLIQDNTYMKDYLAYTLMNQMGVAAPLCSFVQITVDGEPWGLYLAVEGVEDSFLQRNYGKDYGELYKPDSLSFGGGRGNGRDFDMDEMAENFGFSFGDGETAIPDMSQMGAMFDMGNMPDMSSMPGMGGNSDADAVPDGSGRDDWMKGDMPDMGGFGMGSDDVKLVYTDDDPDSYSNIFNNAKTDVTTADQQRLIASLKALNAQDTTVVDTEAVIRYMAVHNFLCNDDSYTGSMVHNYYLYEEDGVLAMIPWDYNLAFGGFQGGSNATSTVNRSIDSLVTGGGDRPMADWITASEEYLAQYHAVYADFVATVFDSGWFLEEFDRVTAMIAPYVESDPTAFCTYEEFRTATDTLRQFCLKRAESVSLQLQGEEAAVDASELDLSTMGGMGGMGGGGPQQGSSRRGIRTSHDGSGSDAPPAASDGTSGQRAPGVTDGQSWTGMPGMPSSTSTTDGQSMPMMPSSTGTTDGQSMPMMPSSTGTTDGQSMPMMPSSSGTTDGQSMPTMPSSSGTTDGQSWPGMPSSSGTTDGQNKDAATDDVPGATFMQPESDHAFAGRPGETDTTAWMGILMSAALLVAGLVLAVCWPNRR